MTRIKASAVLAAVVGLLAGCGVPAAGNKDAATSSSSSEAQAPVAAAKRDAGPADFKATLKIKSKECFGSAGCNVQAEVRLAWAGPANIRPAATDTYDITFTITGGDSGPIVGTIRTAGTKYDAQDEYISTGSSPELAVEITGVEKTS